MALGKILVVFIVFMSLFAFDVKAETKQGRADAGCAKWCKEKPGATTYVDGKCAKDKVMNPFGDSNYVACDMEGCNCEKKDGGTYKNGLNKYVVDEKGQVLEI